MKYRSVLFVAVAISVVFAASSVSRLIAAEATETIRDLEYAQRGEKPLLADVYSPEGPGPFPAVLMVHGGAWRSGSKAQLAFLARRLAQSGYVAVAINYRLAPEHKFPAQIEDCKSAVRWMRQNADKYKIDPNRIAGWGYSAGGHLVALLGTTDADDGLEGDIASGEKTSTRLQAVVPGGAPCDFRSIAPESDRLTFWLGVTRKEKPEIYDQASPAMFVTSDDPPMLFYHGTADELVPLEGVKQMVKLLQSAGVEAEVVEIPGANHIQAALNGAAGAAGIEFLDRHLKNAAPAKPAAAGN